MSAERCGATFKDACVWTEGETGEWVTTCDADVEIRGTPVVEGMLFCCYCGRPLVARPYRSAEDSRVDLAMRLRVSASIIEGFDGNEIAAWVVESRRSVTRLLREAANWIEQSER